MTNEKAVTDMATIEEFLRVLHSVGSIAVGSSVVSLAILAPIAFFNVAGGWGTSHILLVGQIAGFGVILAGIASGVSRLTSWRAVEYPEVDGDQEGESCPE